VFELGVTVLGSMRSTQASWQPLTHSTMVLPSGASTRITKSGLLP
jgi:hypothetical protein